MLTASPATNPWPATPSTPATSPVLTPIRSSRPTPRSCSSSRFSSAMASRISIGRAHRAKRVVLVQDGDAEDRHDRVADVLLDRAAVPLERPPHGGEVAGLDVAEGLGVEPLAHGGGAGEVGEDDGDGLSHLRRRRGPPTPGTRFHRTILRERPPVHCPGMARDYPSVLDLVGGTPIVRLGRVARGLPAQVVAKLEYMNPGGSVKDRIGLPMIEAAEREGKLRAGRDDRRADVGQHRRRRSPWRPRSAATA